MYTEVVGGVYPDWWLLLIVPFFVLLQPISYFYFIIKDRDGRAGYREFLFLAVALVALVVWCLYLNVEPLYVFAGMILVSIVYFSILLATNRMFLKR